MSLPRCTAILRILVVALAAAAAAQGQTNAPYEPSSGASVPRPVQATNAAPAATSVYQRVAGARYGSLFDALNQATSLAEPVLVIPSKEMDPQAVEHIVEDLSVMGRIIEKTLSEDPALRDLLLMSDLPMVGTLFQNSNTRWAFTGAGPDISCRGGRPKPLYLGGYGALFSFQVAIPLLPPPEAPQPAATPEKVDPVWAEAKRSLMEPQSAGAQLSQPGVAPKPYSAERIEALKSRLISAMKYAANIRGLDATDRLVVVVQGPPAQNGQGNADGIGKTVLTLRATRADIELYATDKIDAKQFEQRVQAIIY